MTNNVLDGSKVTIAEACDLLSVTRATLHRWMISGVRGRRLASMKVGGKRLFLRSDLEAFIEREEGGPTIVQPSRRTDRPPSRAVSAGRELAALWGKSIA